MKIRPKVRPKAASSGSKGEVKAKSSAETKPSAKSSAFRAGRIESEKQALERERRMNTPFRFRIKVGESAQVIILDRGTDDTFFRCYEHQFQDSKGRWGQFEQCIKDSGNCPLCDKLQKEGYFAMYLTVLDTRPYTTKEGKTIKYSRKLLPVKTSMIGKFERLYKRHGKFRGMVIELSRDNEKASNIGDSVEFVRFAKEDFLSGLKEGKGEPVDYKKVFPYPTYEQLARRYGAGQLPGSDDFSDEENLDEAEF